MPQSLTVSGVPSSGSSAKRERSADGREVPTQTATAGLNRSSVSLARSTKRIPSYLDKSRSEISHAFQDLEWKQRFRLFHALENPITSPFKVDRSEVVIYRNRYGNVQPWDSVRIRLKTPSGGSDYINASPINLRSRGTTEKQSDKAENGNEAKNRGNKYIATQGPKECSISHFWHMVMQESVGEVGVIVMLTQFYESNKEKCSRYFPVDESNPTIDLPLKEPGDLEEYKEDMGDGELSNVSSNDTVTFKSFSQDTKTRSQLRIFDLKIGEQSKTIYHYLFDGWPDFGKPEADDRVALLELIRQTRQVAGESPRIVHCSAGVGRTGTFIALDFLIDEIEEGRILNVRASSDSDPLVSQDTVVTPTTETWGKSGPPKLVKTPTGADFPSGEDNPGLKDDMIYDTVNCLREQRMMMVMNELQYAFLYEVVREVFLEKFKARPEGAVVKGADMSITSGIRSGLTTDLPKAKVARIEVAAGPDTETETEAETEIQSGGGSGSEAETEIMDAAVVEDVTSANAAAAATEEDPYSAVAPEHIREGIERGAGESSRGERGGGSKDQEGS